MVGVLKFVVNRGPGNMVYSVRKEWNYQKIE